MRMNIIIRPLPSSKWMVLLSSACAPLLLRYSRNKMAWRRKMEKGGFLTSTFETRTSHRASKQQPWHQELPRSTTSYRHCNPKLNLLRSDVMNTHSSKEFCCHCQKESATSQQNGLGAVNFFGIIQTGIITTAPTNKLIVEAPLTT